MSGEAIPDDEVEIIPDDEVTITGTPKSEPSPEAQERMKHPVHVRALAALNKFITKHPLEPDEKEALQYAMRKPSVSPLEASNLAGYNGASLGALGAYVPGYKEKLEAAREQHPWIAGGSEFLGSGITGMFAPGGSLSGAIQGGVGGWNYSDGQSLPERIRQAGEGALYGAVLGKHLPEAIGAAGETMRDAKLAMQGAKTGAGQALQKLERSLGGKKPPTRPAPTDYVDQTGDKFSHQPSPGPDWREMTDRPPVEVPPAEHPPKPEPAARGVPYRESVEHGPRSEISGDEDFFGPQNTPRVPPGGAGGRYLLEKYPEQYAADVSRASPQTYSRQPRGDTYHQPAAGGNIRSPLVDDAQGGVGVRPIDYKALRSIQARGMDDPFRISDDELSRLQESHLGSSHQPTGKRGTVIAQPDPDATKALPEGWQPKAGPRLVPPGQGSLAYEAHGDPAKMRAAGIRGAGEAAKDAKQAVAPWEHDESPAPPIPHSSDKPWWYGKHYGPGDDAAIVQNADRALNLDTNIWRGKIGNDKPPTASLDQQALEKLSNDLAPSTPAKTPLGNKTQAFKSILDEAGIDDYDLSGQDAAHMRHIDTLRAAQAERRQTIAQMKKSLAEVEARKAQGSPKPEPSDSSHLDDVRRELDGKPVTGPYDAFMKLSRGVNNWDDISHVLNTMKTIPGLENVRRPQWAQDAVMARREAEHLAQQSAAPKQPDIFNQMARDVAERKANRAGPQAAPPPPVDPKADERGYFTPGAMFSAFGTTPAKLAAKHVVAPAAGALGRSIERSAMKSMTADAAARYASRDPSVLMSLVSHQGAVGGAARAVLQALQRNDAQDVKAKTAVLEMLPEFREQFAQDTDAQRLGASAATGR